MTNQKKVFLSVGKDVEKMESLCFASKEVKWFSHCSDFSKK